MPDNKRLLTRPDLVMAGAKKPISGIEQHGQAITQAHFQNGEAKTKAGETSSGQKASRREAIL